MGGDWKTAMERARAASDAAGFTRAAAARQEYMYAVDFTISRELVDVRELSIENVAEGCRVHMVFAGSAEAKSRVLDAVEKLPSVARTYRMTYEMTGVSSDGQGQGQR